MVKRKMREDGEEITLLEDRKHSIHFETQVEVEEDQPAPKNIL
jgi:hypothetical protein